MFPDRLRAARKREKLSQVKLAGMLGVSQQTIASWEKGSSNPDIPTLKKLSEIFSLSLDYMLENQEYEMPDGFIVREEPALYGYMEASDEAKKLYCKLCKLDAQELEFIDKIVDMLKLLRRKKMSDVSDILD